MQLLNRVFDRQAVAVPAWHVDRVHALELARLDDHVLQNFVDGVADVDVAVGIGRAVVQHKAGRTAAGSAQLFVNALFFPFLHPARLALGQVAAHGEGGIGQIQGAAVVGSGGFSHGVFNWHVGETADRRRLQDQVAGRALRSSKFGRALSGGWFGQTGR